jgi:hypothetical protein
MLLEGHVENGQIVIDEPATLPEGAKVRVEIVRSAISQDESTADEFWRYAGNLPTTQVEFAAQQEQFRQWRNDSRFERHWPMIDRLLARDFERTRQWAIVAKATQGLTDYDYDAIRDQEACDLQDMREMQERMQ